MEKLHSIPKEFPKTNLIIFLFSKIILNNPDNTVDSGQAIKVF